MLNWLMSIFWIGMVMMEPVIVLFVFEWADVSRWPRPGFFELERVEKCFKLRTGSPYALKSLAPSSSLTGEAKEFLINGFGVICIEMNLLCDAAVALGLVAPCASLFYFVTFGIGTTSFYVVTIGGSCCCLIVLVFELGPVIFI